MTQAALDVFNGVLKLFNGEVWQFVCVPIAPMVVAFEGGEEVGHE